MRDEPEAADSAAWFEELWDFYAPLNPDEDFLERAARNLHSAWWQMYATYCFASHGHELQRCGAFSPDIRVVSPRSLWVEAICPEAGTGTDAAVRRPARSGYQLDRRATRLRYTAALAEKDRQRARHVAAGIVSTDAPYVVAIGGSKIADADLVKDFPEILNALLGLGDIVHVVPIDTDGSCGEGRTEITIQRQLLNKNDAPVATDGFLSGAFTGIAGVLFSPRLPWERPTKPGSEMIFVQNPTAAVTFDPEWIGFGTGYRVVSSADGFSVARLQKTESG